MYIYIHIIHNHYSSVEIPFDGQIVIFWLIKLWRSYSPLLGLLTVAFYFPMRNSSFGESMGHFHFFLRHLKQIQVRSFALQHPWHHRVVSAATHAPYRGECCQDARWADWADGNWDLCIWYIFHGQRPCECGESNNNYPQSSFIIVFTTLSGFQGKFPCTTYLDGIKPRVPWATSEPATSTDSDLQRVDFPSDDCYYDYGQTPRLVAPRHSQNTNSVGQSGPEKFRYGTCAS